MASDFLTVPYLPFSLACGLLVALLLVELAALVLGGSIFTGDAGGPDLDPDLAALQADFDLDADVSPDIDALLAASDRMEALAAAPEAGPGGLAGLLGLGHSPFMIWLAAALTGFGLSGLALQTASHGLGGPLPVWLAVLIAAPLGLAFAGRVARAIARLLPRVETTATSAQFMGGLRGVVTQGTARAGSAAEVRLRDRHGNLHYFRCEPFRDADVIPEGTEVLTLRERHAKGTWRLRILPIT